MTTPPPAPDRRRIFKYPLKAQDSQEVELPYGAQILSVQAQRDDVYVWALVDPIAPTYLQTFYVIGTGNPIPDSFCLATHLGTVQLLGGSLVFHIFLGPRDT